MLVLLGMIGLVSLTVATPPPLYAPVSNNDWTPVEQVFDGVTMVLVPAGCFMMADWSIVHKVCIEESFWLDKFEVTQADFERLGGVKEVANEFYGDARPVERITWFEAEAFCRERRGGRLPTEAEWEFAARGPDRLTYPWGDEFIPENVVYRENSGDQTADVGEGIRTAGASWVGAHDLLGNVAEWTSSIDYNYPYDPTDGREDLSAGGVRVQRGGSFWDFSYAQSIWGRGWSVPNNGNRTVGFRCTRFSLIPVLMPLPTSTPLPHTASVPSPNIFQASEDRAVAGVTANADWTPVERVFNGTVMVLVPAGCFRMGSEDVFDDAEPVHQVCIEAPFWLDKFEVTQANFERVGGVKEVANEFYGDARPVETITWFEAEAFCRERRNGKLPSEAEWEFAARGPDGLIYPWGNEFIPENVVFDGNSGDQTAEVGEGIRTAGASWVGAHDLSGNVWEWTSSLSRNYPYDRTDGREGLTSYRARIFRGGSFFNGVEPLRALFRNRDEPIIVDARVGFRCTRTYRTK